MVLAAGGQAGPSRDALEKLCRACFYPESRPRQARDFDGRLDPYSPISFPNTGWPDSAAGSLRSLKCHHSS